MLQFKHESSINWNGYAKIAIHIATRLSEAHIEESSVYASLMLTEFCIPLIDKQEQLLFMKLDIGAAFIRIGEIYNLFQNSVIIYKDVTIRRYNCGTVTEKSPEMWYPSPPSFTVRMRIVFFGRW